MGAVPGIHYETDELLREKDSWDSDDRRVGRLSGYLFVSFDIRLVTQIAKNNDGHRF